MKINNFENKIDKLIFSCYLSPKCIALINVSMAIPTPTQLKKKKIETSFDFNKRRKQVVLLSLLFIIP